MNEKFFLYARKSTDVEDKQVLSIEAQVTELRTFAREQGLDVIEELIEKQSAKIPGRPIFGQMLRRIERGEANGIVSWHPDRLARNSVDGGQIVYFLDIGKLASLKFPNVWFENTPQGKFTLSISFFQTNSEFLARWRALIFRRGGGSKSRAIQIQYLLWIQKEFLL